MVQLLSKSTALNGIHKRLLQSRPEVVAAALHVLAYSGEVDDGQTNPGLDLYLSTFIVVVAVDSTPRAREVAHISK